jgi:hypothetical protein
MTRDELTRKILAAKRAKSLTWKTITAEIGGGSAVYLTAALMGQMKLRPEQAARAARLFGLSEDEQHLLQEIPYRGSLPTAVPTDPLIYRLYEPRAGIRHELEGIDPGGVWRRHHERDRFRHVDRTPTRPERRSRQADVQRQIPPI